MKNLILIILFSLPAITFSYNQEKIPEYPVKFQLKHYNIEGQNVLALGVHNFKKWHTYWKNPGDSGQPFQFQFFINGEEIKIESFEWPTPKKYIEKGNILAYGYEKDYAFYFKLPKNLYNKLQNKKLTFHGKWLVCKHICIPGEGKVTGLFNESFSESFPKDFEAKINFRENFQSIPKEKKWPNELDFKLVKASENKLAVFYSMVEPQLKSFPKDKNFLYPFPLEPFTFLHEKVVIKDGVIYGKIDIEWDGEYMDPPQAFPKDYSFNRPRELKFLFFNHQDKSSSVLTKVVSTISKTDYKNLDQLFSEDIKINPLKTEKKSILYYLLFAFIGGFILNFMPCVLPVISLKLFELVKYKNSGEKSIFKHNISYTFGVLFSFLVLGIVVLMIKSAGTEIGWGFQLQSPTFVAIMVIILVVFSLNLFGLFEFKTPFGNKIGNIKLGEGFFSDFGNGILATVLATPCSAPFLGTALTFAFTTSSLNIILMFLMIGLGLSLPFILTAFFPAMVSILPNPGNWMISFKKFLGLTLLLTAIWLGTIFYALVTPSTLNKVGNLKWEKWSEKRMSELKGEVVFIDFTAKWCITCKANEKLVLNTDEFEKLVKEKNIKLLLGDWTKRNEDITIFLKKYGAIGVPLYLIQQKDGTIVSLGETISIDEIREKIAH